MKLYSSLVDMLLSNAQDRPDDRAVVFMPDAQRQETILSHRALYQHAATLAAKLSDHAAQGDRALLLFPTGVEFVVSYFACMMAGIIAVPLMPPRKNAGRDSSAAIIADCSPKLVLTAGGERDGLHSTLRQRFADAGILHIPVELTQEHLSYTARPCSAASLAFLQYTSGSTSTPKGVMVSHGNLLANLEMMRQRLGNTSSSHHVSWIPLYHDLGLIMNLLQPLYVGATSVLMTPSAFMHRPLNWLRAIHQLQAEVAAAPNFAYDLCVDRFRADHLEGVDLSAWKVAVNGAEPVRPETLTRFAQCFAPYGFSASALHPTYGLAEATLVVSSAVRGRGAKILDVSAGNLHERKIAAPQSADDLRHLAGCGHAVDGVEIAIVDPVSCRPQTAHCLGEIWLRGASIAKGYWNRPTETTDIFDAVISSEGAETHGWLRTGDLGYIDNDGEVYIAGRIKDVIIIRGVNYYPQDIEATAAAAHSALRRDHGAVFTVADSDGNQQVVLVQEVERTQRHTLDEREIAMAIRKAVTETHDIALGRIVLLRPGTIPKTTSGKIQRHKARQLWLDNALDVLSPSSVLSETVSTVSA
ncbi:acyl-CoA synthetase (AMP-forming)/AMP-acid ligase II [Agrobacterium vitis]|nr:acyl-CoA synthetase (AMP-forming)/AMP-acid ligase II [Agrobacterium vitis]MBE1436558.1 acyl-CoA synthetase (AMP-forming)/AMP-acid ligase II [Agrobacterium vitis]